MTTNKGRQKTEEKFVPFARPVASPFTGTVRPVAAPCSTCCCALQMMLIWGLLRHEESHKRYNVAGWCSSLCEGKGKGKRSHPHRRDTRNWSDDYWTRTRTWICIAPCRDHTSKALRYGTRSDGISQFYLHTPRTSANGMNHTCLCLPSRSWYSFTDPGGIEGWVEAFSRHPYGWWEYFTNEQTQTKQNRWGEKKIRKAESAWCRPD